MAQSYKEYSGGELSATTYSVPFKYLNIDDVHAIGFDGDKWTVIALHAETPRSIADKTITLAAVPSSYTKIRVYRATATTQLVDFQDGSRLSESDLDTAYQQGLFVSQEMAEDANTAQFAALLEASLQSGTSLSNFASQEMAADGTNGLINGTNGEFTITAFTPATTVPEAYRVTIDGVMQSPTDAYSVTISPSKITFTSAPPSGSKIVIVTAASAATATSVDNVTIGLTSNNRAQIIDGSITNAKLAGSITQDKLAGGITNDQLAGSIAQDKLDGLSITNAELAGSITEDKLSGSIPQSKLSLDLIDDDTFTTGVSATSLASSESIKAYVDNNGGSFTPSTYAGGKSLTFPNGFIMKFGTINITSATATYSHDFTDSDGNLDPFPTACVHLSGSKDGANSYGNLSVSSKTKDGWTGDVYTSQTGQYSYIAFGY